METLNDLTQIVKAGLEIVKQEPDLIEGLVYASANRRTVGRLVYTTHIPSNGLEEPKSDEDFGVTVEIWFKKNGKKVLGFGTESSDISLEAVKKALAKAKRDAVEDPDFIGFLKKKDLPKNNKPLPLGYADKKLIDLNSAEEAKMLAKMGWETLQGAVETVAEYATKQKKSSKDLAFIVNGDNFIIRERMALATTGGIHQSDETTVLLSFITAMLEKENSKGSSWGARLTMDGFSAYDIGKKAAQAAIRGVGGKRIKSGNYKVIFGHQAVTELFGTLLTPHANLMMVDFGATIFRGKYNQKVASPLLTIYDDGTLPEGAGTKRVTDEGAPTGRTMLIDKGKLVGYLADYKTTSKLLQKVDHAKVMLGVDPHQIKQAMIPNNGFRYSMGGGRVAASQVGINATNLVIDSDKPISPEKLIKNVGEGIFIGRLWYTYPVGGYSSGIISGTAIADCYFIKDGKLAEPILPNTIRLEDNLGKMIMEIIGIGNNKEQTINWASDEITHAPWVAIDNVNLIAINEGTKN